MNKKPRDITIIYMCTIKWKSYDVWFRRYGVWQAKVFCHFGPFFALLPTSNPKNQNFEKIKKTSGDIIILHRCIINNNRMMYGSWAISCDRQKFSSFWLMFYPFSPLTIQKIKILKLNNAPGDIIILHISTINYNHMMHGSWDMERDRQILLLFWTVICPLTPPPPHPPSYGPRKSKFWKNKKAPEDIIILQMCTMNSSHLVYGSWDMECIRQNYLSFSTVFCSFTP